MLIAATFALLGFWTSADVHNSMYCGAVSASRRDAGLLPNLPDDIRKNCERLKHAGWTKEDYASEHCFDLYNDRPYDAHGILPYSAEARQKSDACFKSLDHQ